MLDCYKFCKLP